MTQLQKDILLVILKSTLEIEKNTLVSIENFFSAEIVIIMLKSRIKEIKRQIEFLEAS